MRITTEIVSALGHSQSCDPSDLEYALQEHIDLDAIEQLASHEPSTWILTFELPEQRVRLTNNVETTVETVTEVAFPAHSSKTNTEARKHCPQCGQRFERDRNSNERNGYSLIGKGNELSLIRCEGCATELPVPETQTRKSFSHNE